ncbi:MAG: hypothetical protein AB8B49_08685 [Nitratireductor sp.]
MSQKNVKDEEALERRKKALRDNLRKRKAVVKSIDKDETSDVLTRKTQIESKVRPN